MIMRYLVFGLSMILSFAITLSLDLTYETRDLEESEYDPLHLLHRREFKIDPDVERLKRGTTIVHRVRRRRPKPYRKIRRPPKRISKPRPVYGPPQIHIHTPFSSPSGPSYSQNPYTNSFAEPPTAPSIPTAPSSSVAYPPNNKNPSMTQFQSQLSTQYAPPPPPPPNQPPIKQYYPQGPSVYQQSSGNYQQSSQNIFSSPGTATLSTPSPSIPSISSSSSSNPSISSSSIPSSDQSSFTSSSDLTRLHPFTFSSPNNGSPSVHPVGIPTQSIPLENVNQGDPYRNTISSYDVPVNSFTVSQTNPSINSILNSRPQSTINFNPPKGLPNSEYDILQGFSPSLPSPPILPIRYDTNDFPSISSKLPDNRFNNYNKGVFDDDSFENFFNDVSESKRVNVRTKPKSKSKYNKGKDTSKTRSKSKNKPTEKPVSVENSSYFDDDEDEDVDEDFSIENYRKRTTTTTTTTKRPKTRRRKRPKVSSTTQHNLDADDFKDAFDSASEIQEYIITPDGNSDFESKKYYKVSKTPIVTKSTYLPRATTTKQPTTNYVLISSQNDFEEDPTYITQHIKTEKPLIKVPPFTYRPRHILKTTPKQTIYQTSPVVDDSDIKILSVQKSNSHSYYAGSEKENFDQSNFDYGYNYPNNDDFDSFSTGVFLSNNGFGTRIKHGRNKKDLDNEEGYVFETEYEIEFPTNHQFYKK